MSANYVFSPTTMAATEEKSLQDLAESIRRMRLRRHTVYNSRDPEGDDASLFASQEDHRDDESLSSPQRLGHRYYNDVDPPEPRDEFELLKSSEEEGKRLEQLEQRIRATQDRHVKKELQEKRMEDKMEESIKALKELTSSNHDGIGEHKEDVAQESFTG